MTARLDLYPALSLLMFVARQTAPGPLLGIRHEAQPQLRCQKPPRQSQGIGVIRFPSMRGRIGLSLRQVQRILPLQCQPYRPPPGRRWRTESPQRWPPSAAQTWCAVFPRHAFTKALASALQWKESASPVAPAHTRHTSCASVAVSSRSCASICTDATKCAARSNCRVG
jgi:hypothetical protein